MMQTRAASQATKPRMGGAVKNFGNRPAQKPFSKIMLPLVAAAVLALVGWGTDFTVQRAMKGVFAAKLQTILDTDVLALRIWLETQKRAVNTAVAVPGVRDEIRKLGRFGEGGGR